MLAGKKDASEVMALYPCRVEGVGGVYFIFGPQDPTGYARGLTN